RHRLAESRARAAHARAALGACNPRERVAALEQRRRWSSERLERAMARRLERAAARLALAGRALAPLSPLATLDRGYAIVARDDDGTIVTDAANVAAGTALDIRLARGRLKAATTEAGTPERPPSDSS